MFKISKSLSQKALQNSKLSVEEIISADAFSLRKTGYLLTQNSVRNKISWDTSNPYNKRWHYKWKHSWYTYLRDGKEHEYVKKPEDSKDANPIFWTWIQDFLYRGLPGLNCWWDRRHRMFDPFQVYVLPGTSLFFYQFSDVTFGFKWLSFVPWLLFYTRLRDKTLDPDFKETYLRQMLYSNPVISKYFAEETIVVYDYDCEFDKGFPDPNKFPEYTNKVFRFFNTDTGMTTGHFTFGDVESGAFMKLSFKTMPAPGKYRYQVGEPFFFYDLKADITHKGEFIPVVLVDENESLKKIRPFLFLI